MQDDPGNNRVIITFGSAVATIAAQLVEDGWPWGNPDGMNDDEWESWADDSQANSSTVTPSVLLSLEDGWLDPDETVDEIELLEQSSSELPRIRSLPSPVLGLEDGWNLAFDDTAEDWESWQYDSFANASTVVGSALLSLEDGWLDPDDAHDDTMELVLSSTTGWNQNG